MTMVTVGAVIFAVGMLLMHVANREVQKIIDEVNTSNLTRVSLFTSSARLFDILSSHAELYPTSNRRRSAVLVGIASGILTIVGGLLLGNAIASRI